MSKIVVLDGYTINPGDLSWSGLEEFGHLTVYDHTPEELVDERIGDADIVLSSKILFSRDRLRRLPNLRYLGALATGYNVFDVKAAAELGITVTNIPEYATSATAQMTIALLLELADHVGHHDRLVHEGRWTETTHFCFWDKPLTELTGKTIGIVGFGRIGRRVAIIASALGMKVLASGRNGNSPSLAETNHHSLVGVKMATFSEILEMADYITFHCPLNEDTRELVNRKTIAQMKDGVYLINASRGGIFEEAAVAEALASGKIAGAAIDVLSVEPPTTANPLLSAPNCIITPHIAWAPKETRQRLIDTVVTNVRAFLAGNPVHVVS
jgi:glycerate dehydrogenase